MKKLENSLGFLITRAARSMKRALNAQLAEYNITASQYIVLKRLWEGNELSLSELGKSLYFDNPTITGIIDRMEKENLAKRKKDKNDRRVIKIVLTEKGKRLEDILEKEAETINTMACSHLDKEETEHLRSLLIEVWKQMASLYS